MNPASTIAMLINGPNSPLTAWTVEIDEVSAGVYRIRCTHPSGLIHESTGVSPEQLRAEAETECRRLLLELERSQK